MKTARNLFATVLAMLVVAGTLSVAEARRVRIPVVVPGIGSSEKLVKVQDLPRRPEFVHEDGAEINLGYLFKRDGTGEWVGHIGSKTKYLRIKPEFQAEFLQLAGLSDFPEPPQRSATAGDGGGLGAPILVAGILGFVVVGGLVVVLRRRGKNAASPETSDTSGQWSEAAIERLDSRSKSAGAAPVAPVARPAFHRPARTARVVTAGSAPMGARAAFGRRG